MDDRVLRAADTADNNAPARLLETLRSAHRGLVKEYTALVPSGRIAPERECIHGRPAAGFGEWMQYDFLGMLF